MREAEKEQREAEERQRKEERQHELELAKISKKKKEEEKESEQIRAAAAEKAKVIEELRAAKEQQLQDQKHAQNMEKLNLILMRRQREHRFQSQRKLVIVLDQVS